MEEEAFFGVGRVDAGDAFAFDFGAEDLVGAAFGDPLVVIFGEEGVGGELQAAAAFDAAVAGGAVAGAFGEDGSDVAGEGKGALGGGVFDGDLGLGAEAVEFRFDGGGAVGDGGGAVTRKITNSTNITSTSGVVLISASGACRSSRSKGLCMMSNIPC